MINRYRLLVIVGLKLQTSKALSFRVALHSTSLFTSAAASQSVYAQIMAAEDPNHQED